MRTHLALTLIAAFTLLLVACRPAAAPPAASSGGAYTPGLGEIMSLQQMRHAKLWFAGQAANWMLADYELKELREGFDDAIAMHGSDKDFPLPVKDVMPKKITVPLQDLDTVIKAQNLGRFDTAFDALTTACNECHQAENFGFNVIQRPASNPDPNQLFTP
jgi:hypothetical protein